MTAPPAGLLMRGRLWVIAAIVIPTLYALFVNLPALDDPPAWDSSTTVSPAALTIVEHDFDIWTVANLPGTLDGGPSTHSTSVYTIGLAMLIAWLGPASGFFLAHVMSIALIGALSGTTYLLARLRLSVKSSVLVAVAVGVLPMIVQQSADIYLDLPLAIITTLACWTASRRWFRLTVGLAFMGVAIKTSAVFLIPLILLARPLTKPLSRHVVHIAVGGSLAVLPFLPAFLTTDRFETEMTFEAQSLLVRSSINMLALTVDVFVIVALFILIVYGRARNKDLDRVSKVTAVLLLSFLATYFATVVLSGTIAVLPRYYIAILPAVVACLPPVETPDRELSSRRRLMAVVGFSALVVFSLLNRHGDLYPLPDHSFYVLAERSTRAQDLLQLQREGTNRLVATGLPVVVGLPEHFRLLYPDMGYVAETPDEVISLVDGWPDELPDKFAMLNEPRFNNPVDLIEEAAENDGFDLEYETLRDGGFESQMVVATRSPR